MTKTKPVEFHGLASGDTDLVPKLKELLVKCTRPMNFHFVSFPGDKIDVGEYQAFGRNSSISCNFNGLSAKLFDCENKEQIKAFNSIDAHVLEENELVLLGRVAEFSRLKQCFLDVATDNLGKILKSVKLPRGLYKFRMSVQDKGEGETKYASLMKGQETNLACYKKAVDMMNQEEGIKDFLKELSELEGLREFGFIIGYSFEKQYSSALLSFAITKALGHLRKLLIQLHLASNTVDNKGFPLNFPMLTQFITYPEDIVEINISCDHLTFEGYEKNLLPKLKYLQFVSEIMLEGVHLESYLRFIEEISKSNIRHLINVPFTGPDMLKILKKGNFRNLRSLEIYNDEQIKQQAENFTAIPEGLKYFRLLREVNVSAEKAFNDAVIKVLRKNFKEHCKQLTKLDLFV